jgi:hypothetical protein
MRKVERAAPALRAVAPIPKPSTPSVDRFERIASQIAIRNPLDPLDALLAGRVAKLISQSWTAAHAVAQVQKLGAELILDFGLGPAGLMGLANCARNSIRVFVRNHRSPAEVVSTLVHESSHLWRAARGARHSQLDEVRARSREFLHQHGRRPTLAERREIWREVEDFPSYADLPRR